MGRGGEGWQAAEGVPVVRTGQTGTQLPASALSLVFLKTQGSPGGVSLPLRGHPWHLDRPSPLALPEANLQEEARLPELPEVPVAVALAGVMVGGPVFAAQVENEWVTDAERTRRHEVRGCPVGSSRPGPQP